MAQFSDPNVRLHDTGASAQAVFLVGSKRSLLLQYVQPAGTGAAEPVDISGWALTAKGEWREGEFDAEDSLTALLGIVSGTAVATPAVAADADQTANKGVFGLVVDGDTVPAAARDVDIDATTLPTLCVWVRLASPDGGVVDQARVAIGFRRGFASL